MFNKLYSKVSLFIRKNISFIIILIIGYLIVNIPIPYYIHATGGLINISEKVNIEGEKKKSGSFNLAYVTEIKGNVLTYLMSYILPSWDLVKKEEVKNGNESDEEVSFRNKMLLNEANQNAVFLAYSKSHKYINIVNQNTYVVYIDSKADTDLKIGDEILGINNHLITNADEYISIVNTYNIGDKLMLKVKTKDNKIVARYAKVINYDNKKVTGIYIITKNNYVTDPTIKLHFKRNESGPSGGFMMALSIYDKLTTDSLTKGKKIVGTGTIDILGNVGEISGIEYKLKGAVKEKADIFFAPMGVNYDEALALKRKEHYNIEIVGVSTFNDALNYLKSL